MTRSDPNPCPVERNGLVVVGMGSWWGLETVVGVENCPWKGAGIHRTECVVETVGRGTLVEKGLPEEESTEV